MSVFCCPERPEPVGSGLVPEGGVCACEACTSASSPCIDVVSGPVSMHVVSYCVLHDLSLVLGTISAAFPLATPIPIGGRMPSVASGPCGVSVSFFF